MVDGRRRGRREKFLKLADGCGFLELDLIQVHLVASLESTHQFDAIERTELQIGFEAGGFGVQLNGTAGDFCYERRQRGVVVGTNV